MKEKSTNFHFSQQFRLENGIIYTDSQDLENTISSASNVKLLQGEAHGSERVALAIENALSEVKSDIELQRFYSAKKVIINIRTIKSLPLLLVESEALVDFSKRFSTETVFIWGVDEENGTDETLRISMIALDTEPK